MAAVRSRPHVQGWLCDTILATVPQRQTWLACPMVCFHLPSPFVPSGTWLLTYSQQRGALAKWAAGPGPATCGSGLCTREESLQTVPVSALLA